jgi:homoserine dehydrogenase
MDRVAVGLLGLGTVGSGVARLLTEANGRIARRSGKQIVLKWALVRDTAQTRNVPLEREHIVSDWAIVRDDPDVAIVVELIGGIDPTLQIVLEALAAGKDVVTANKALLAEHAGPEPGGDRQRNV